MGYDPWAHSLSECLAHAPRINIRMSPPFPAGPLFAGVTGEVSLSMRRSLLIASLGLVAGFGCHASPQRNPTKIETPITRTDVSVTRFITQHNQNVAAIHSLEASPKINMIGDDGSKKFRSRADGHLALEEGKNFRLEVEAMRHELADIGSNERGFWFWVDDDKEKSIYVCDHKDSNSLAVTLQPDWILEAMGLRAFTHEEARTVSAKPGEIPGTIVLTQTRQDAKKQRYTKETILNEQTGTIREHRLWAGVKEELLASATIFNYQAVRFVSAPIDRGGDAGLQPVEATESVVQLPEKFRLNWVKEKLVIEITMPSVKVNPTFPEEKRLALFSRPEIPGTTVRDLAQLDPEMTDAPERTYQSRPMPDAGGIRLGHPEPSFANGVGLDRRSVTPAPLSTDLSPSPTQGPGVIGAPIPSVDSGAVRTSVPRRWRSSSLAQ